MRTLHDDNIEEYIRSVTKEALDELDATGSCINTVKQLPGKIEAALGCVIMADIQYAILLATQRGFKNAT